MSYYKINSLRSFEKEAKRLVKKYPSLKLELAQLISSLKQNPSQGTFLGNNCYKIRLSISSKHKGKSGGARVITHFYISEETVYLLYIYDKSELSSVSEKTIKEFLKLI